MYHHPVQEDLTDIFVPSPTIVGPNPVFEEMLERRAAALCLNAEPHGNDGSPCFRHVSEARIQLFDLRQRQEDARDLPGAWPL